MFEPTKDEKIIGAITGGTLAIVGLLTALALLSQVWNTQATSSVTLEDEAEFEELMQAHGGHGGGHGDDHGDGHGEEGEQGDHAEEEGGH